MLGLARHGTVRGHGPLRGGVAQAGCATHSNFIERTIGETRRRTNVIGRLPGETSCLTLVWAVLHRASRG